MDLAGKLNQTAVYWAPDGTGPSGTGNISHDAGVEVATRIDNVAVLDKGVRGDDKRSEMVAYFLPESNVVKNGRLFDGLLADLTAEQIASPGLVPDAFIIRAVVNTPSLDASQTLVTAELDGRSS